MRLQNKAPKGPIFEHKLSHICHTLASPGLSPLRTSSLAQAPPLPVTHPSTHSDAQSHAVGIASHVAGCRTSSDQ